MLLTSIKDIKDEQVEECMEPDNTDLDCPVFTNVRHILKVRVITVIHDLLMLDVGAIYITSFLLYLMLLAYLHLINIDVLNKKRHWLYLNYS